MRQTKARNDIQTMLLEWARWRSIGHGANVGYPSCTAFYRMSKMGGWGAKMPTITDDDAGRIDLAVSRLKLRCVSGDYRWEALTDSYLGGKTDSAIARRLKCDRRTVMSARRAAESWVEAHIDISLWHSDNTKSSIIEDIAPQGVVFIGSPL
jgi:hypothetical protein